MKQKNETTDINDVVDKAELSGTDPITFRQAAKYLGLSQSTLYKLTSAKKIAHWKPGGKLLLFSKADLDAYVWQNRVASEFEIRQIADRHVIELERKKNRSNGNS
jgi:excisionase family DNA binding protein